jgi:hypothetical protein
VKERPSAIAAILFAKIDFFIEAPPTTKAFNSFSFIVTHALIAMSAKFLVNNNDTDKMGFVLTFGFFLPIVKMLP